MLNKNEQKYLRTLAQSLKATVQIGKNGVNEGTVKSLNEALQANELVKVSVLQNAPISRSVLVDELAKVVRAEVVQGIGRQIVLYRRNHEKPRIDLSRVK